MCSTDDGENPYTEIAEIKGGFTNDGQPVTVRGVVTAVGQGGLYVQHSSLREDAGIFVRPAASTPLPSTIVPGAPVEVTGTVEPSSRNSRYARLANASVSPWGEGRIDIEPIPLANLVPPYADPYIGMLVRVPDLAVTDLFPPELLTEAWRALGPPGLSGVYQYIDIYRDPVEPAGLAVGTRFQSVTGVLGYRGTNYVLTLTLRSAQDFAGQVNP